MKSVEQVLDKADALGDVRSISIPPISCTSIGFDEDECASIMLQTCVGWLDKNCETTCIQNIRICNSNEVTSLFF